MKQELYSRTLIMKETSRPTQYSNKNFKTATSKIAVKAPAKSKFDSIYQMNMLKINQSDLSIRSGKYVQPPAQAYFSTTSRESVSNSSLLALSQKGSSSYRET